jgi:hypothetical protein
MSVCVYVCVCVVGTSREGGGVVCVYVCVCVCLDGLFGGDIVRRTDDIVSTPFAWVPGEEWGMNGIWIGLRLGLGLRGRDGKGEKRRRRKTK